MNQKTFHEKQRDDILAGWPDEETRHWSAREALERLNEEIASEAAAVLAAEAQRVAAIQARKESEVALAAADAAAEAARVAAAAQKELDDLAKS